MGGFIGGLIGGSGAKSGAKQGRQDVNQAVGRLDPFAAPGASATNALSSLLLGRPGATGGEGLQRFRESIGFNDAQNRSLRGVASNAAAKGLLGSSGTGERFQQTANELASSSFQDFLKNLFGLQSSAQAAATDQASLLAKKPTSKGLVRQGIGSDLSTLFLG